MATTTNLLQHPTHHHPLVHRDISKDSSIRPLCRLCDRKLSADAYTCQEKCEFYNYHRVCAEAPPQIYPHPLHPRHSLTLLHCRAILRCQACGGLFSSLFRCTECDFNLDIFCALSTLSDRGGSQGGTNPEQITIPLHRHPLTSFSTRLDFVRDGNCVICKARVEGEGDGYMCLHGECEFLGIHKRCIRDVYYADGTKPPRIFHSHPLETFLGEDMGSTRCASCGSNASSGEFIGCARCEVFIHRDCIQIPEILQYPHHPNHTLVLFINHPENHQTLCDSCLVFLEGELCYGCRSCMFFLHVGCALQTLAYCDEGMSAEIEWRWHEHSLLLCHKAKSRSNYCFYCGDESTGPTYVCHSWDCRFLLHERCTKIEPSMIHPHHPDHPLTLSREADGPPPHCKACCKPIDGLNFSCEVCAVYLHSRCAAHVPTRKHYLHEHELIYMNEAPSLECNRCGISTDSPFFRCVPCNFNLHETCMELPRIVKSKIHWHPLTLQETFVEDDSGEYYCEHCEKKRDIRLGVYVCGRCKISLPRIYHIECVLPELGKVYAKIQTSAVKRMAEKIAVKRGQVSAAEEKLEDAKRELDELKRELDELMKENEELIS